MVPVIHKFLSTAALILLVCVKLYNFFVRASILAVEIIWHMIELPADSYGLASI